ncbi:MAG: nucleotide sugar dehydrogenase [Alphaproteobacteria bacterium]|nr:MAG: nucleotide sugar dehydrogenase [Alphaproteobacteria bacterium]
MPPIYSIAVIGLGYVGLPLAIGLARVHTVTGFDINNRRLAELHRGTDSTAEVAPEDLRTSTLTYTNQLGDISGKDVYIVTVPTPITDKNEPDLTPLMKASETVGKAIKKGAIVVYESTVYPGVTEDVCAPILEKFSGLKAGKHFHLGYSPERINPGDKVHTVATITKIVAGETPEITDLLADIYGSINSNNIFKASSIKTAEAAKVIENAQRDINIAFMNEICMIFTEMGLNTHDVLDAAKSKWNFLPFSPGLVGGHCIGVDPYYLAHAAKNYGQEPKIILSGREINESMSYFLASKIHDEISKSTPTPAARILLLGLTFKENVPDLRNTKIIDLVRHLRQFGHRLEIHDPLADVNEAKDLYDLDIHVHLEQLQGFDAVIGAVPHAGYKNFTSASFEKLLTPNGVILDIKRIWSSQVASSKMRYWSI